MKKRVGLVFSLALTIQSLQAIVPLHNGTSDTFAKPLQWQAYHEGKWQDIQVPGYWQSLHASSRGQLQYRLSFELSAQGQAQRYSALEAGEIHSASVIRLNDTEICRTGLVGDSRSEEKGRIYPQLCPFPVELLTRENVLEILVSNYHTRSGGILQIRLGQREDFEQERQVQLSGQGFYMGLVALAGLVFLILFFAHQQIPYLLFFLISVLINLRIFSSNGFLELYSPGDDQTDLRFFLEYATAVSLLPLAFVWYFHFLLPLPRGSRYFRSLHRLALTYFTILPLFALAYISMSFDASLYGRYQPQMVYAILLPAAAYIWIYQAWQALRGVRQAWLTLAGYSFLALAVFHDAIVAVQGIAGPLYVPVGMFGFCSALCASMAWSVRGLRKKLETSYQELQESHLSLRQTEEIKDRIVEEAAQSLSQALKEMERKLLTLVDSQGLEKRTADQILAALDLCTRTLLEADRTRHYLLRPGKKSRSLSFEAFLTRLRLQLESKGLRSKLAGPTQEATGANWNEELLFVCLEACRSLVERQGAQDQREGYVHLQGLTYKGRIGLQCQLLPEKPLDLASRTADYKAARTERLPGFAGFLVDQILKQQEADLYFRKEPPGFLLLPHGTATANSYHDRHQAFLWATGHTWQARRANQIKNDPRATSARE